MNKLNDIIIGQKTVNQSGHKLNETQISKLSKDQREGRSPVYILGIKGYLGGDGIWTSEKYINKLKKEGNWS